MTLYYWSPNWTGSLEAAWRLIAITFIITIVSPIPPAVMATLSKSGIHPTIRNGPATKRKLARRGRLIPRKATLITRAGITPACRLANLQATTNPPHQFRPLPPRKFPARRNIRRNTLKSLQPRKVRKNPLKSSRKSKHPRNHPMKPSPTALPMEMTMRMGTASMTKRIPMKIMMVSAMKPILTTMGITSRTPRKNRKPKWEKR